MPLHVHRPAHLALAWTSVPCCCAAWPALQLVDKQQELVRVQKTASFNSINIQASSGSATGAGLLPTHVLAEDETPVGTPMMADVSLLKGGDGYDRLLEYRCGRYLYNHAQGTYLPVPAMPADFSATLRGVAGSRNIKGAHISG